MRQNYQATGQNTFPTQNNASTIYNNRPIEHQNPNTIPQALKTQHKQHQNAKIADYSEQSIKNWFISLALFILPFGVYAGVWAVDNFALAHQIASHYYQKSYNWVDSMPVQFQTKVTSTQKSIALQLVLQWVMWKAPLLLFTYNCIRLKQGALKWIILGVISLILLAADILLTIFVLNIYNNMMYFGLFSLLTVISAIVCNSSLNRTKQAILDSLLPLLSIALLYAFHNLALPILYKVYQNNLSAEATVFLAFYAFPFVDLLMYIMLLFLGSYVSKEVRTFYSVIHFLLLGYQVGFIMLVGYTEVEFYYLCSYLIFRNIFSNWVMWKWDDILKLPPILPGWILPYYFSYVFMFIPFGGIGNIVLSVGYYSIILINTGTLLYNLPSSLYPSNLYTPPTTITGYQLNIGFKGHIYWIAAAILWVATTFTQRYSKKRPQIVYSLIYNMVGIYLFYLGISAGISTQSLTKYSLIS